MNLAGMVLALYQAALFLAALATIGEFLLDARGRAEEGRRRKKQKRIAREAGDQESAAAGKDR